MNDQQVTQVKQAVGRYLRSRPAFNFANPKHFPRLVEHVRHAVIGDRDAALAEDELHCVVAMCGLGPPRGQPPRAMREELLGIVREHGAGDAARALEFAVAYGCGKWRAVSQGTGDWTRRWDGAFFTLVRVIESAVKKCNHWLADPRVVAYPTADWWGSEDGKDLIASDAHVLSLLILDPVRPLHIKKGQELQIRCTEDGTEIEVCDGPYATYSPPGSKWVFETSEPARLRDSAEEIRPLEPNTRVTVSARDAEARITAIPTMPRVTLKSGNTAAIVGSAALRLWSCRCGHVQCPEKHRLDAWNPTPVVTLWSYLASAVKGPLPGIQSGSFMEGMYSSLLATEGNGYSMRVRLAPVEYTLCASDTCREEKRYEGDRCPQCRTPYHPGTTRRKAFDQLIVDADIEIYERQARLHCKKCDNLYSAPACPLCGSTPRVRRPTHVWVRTFGTRLPLDDDANLRDRLSDKKVEENGRPDTDQRPEDG